MNSIDQYKIPHDASTCTTGFLFNTSTYFLNLGAISLTKYPNYDVLVVGLSYLTCVLLARQSGENWEKALSQILLYGRGSIFDDAVPSEYECPQQSVRSFERVGSRLSFPPRQQLTRLDELFTLGRSVATGVDIEVFDPEFRRLFLAGDTSSWVDQPRGHRSLEYESHAQCLETHQVLQFTNCTCIDLADVHAMMMSEDRRVRDIFPRGLLCLVCLPGNQGACLVRIGRYEERFALTAFPLGSVTEAWWRQGHSVLRAC